MKGGNYLTLEAIRQLARASFTTPLPITVLFTPDEEVGTPSTRDIIEAEAARNKYVLVPEPGRENNGVVTGRYAIARFNLEAIGKPSHAGATLSSGRSAIREMARQVLAIDGMTTADCTFSVGIVHGGQWVNCVATTCTGEALSMAKRQTDLDRGVERMLALSGTNDDVTFKVTRGVTRPVWEPDAGTMALYEKAKGIAAQLGQTLPHGSAGGGSDGNFTGAMGIPTLDGLGVRGADAHTLNEHIIVDSLAERGRLMAGTPAAGSAATPDRCSFVSSAGTALSPQRMWWRACAMQDSTYRKKPNRRAIWPRCRHSSTPGPRIPACPTCICRASVRCPWLKTISRRSFAHDDGRARPYRPCGMQNGIASSLALLAMTSLTSRADDRTRPV